MRACGFTGYRPEKLPFKQNEKDMRCLQLKAELENQIRIAIQDGFTHFICGGARGSDTFAAEAVLQMQETYPNLVLEIAVPFLQQDANWSSADRRRYYSVLERAQRITYLSIEQQKNSYFIRNRYIVDHAERLIAIFDGKRGGTAQTVHYAQQQQREIVCIRPDGTLSESE